MADSAHPKCSSNQLPQRTEWSPQSNSRKGRGDLGWRHCSQMPGQGLTGVVPRRQHQAQAEMGCNLTISALPPSREVPPKHKASSLLSSQQLLSAPFPDGSRPASAKAPHPRSRPSAMHPPPQVPTPLLTLSQPTGASEQPGSFGKKAERCTKACT